MEDGYSGCCYSPNTWFDMKIFDVMDNEVLHLARDRQFQCLRFTRGSPVYFCFTLIIFY